MADRRKDSPKLPATPKGKRGTKARGRRPMDETLPLFVQHYLGEGKRNATATAIMMGANPRSAHQKGYLLLQQARKLGMLQVAAQRLSTRLELTTERTLMQVMRVAYGDTRRFFNADGSAKLPDEWDDDMAPLVASVEMGHAEIGIGKNAKLVPFVKKLRFRDSLAASDMLMRHQGLFERDNRQQQGNLAIQINLVGAPTPPRTLNGTAVSIQPNLVGPKTNGSNGSHA